MIFITTFILIIFEYKLIKTLNIESQNYVIALHNMFRSQLTQGQSANLSGENMPSGKNIKQMSYSNYLENIAQNWADKCTYSHSGNQYGECFSAFGPKYNESMDKKYNGCGI